MKELKIEMKELKIDYVVAELISDGFDEDEVEAFIVLIETMVKFLDYGYCLGMNCRKSEIETDEDLESATIYLKNLKKNETFDLKKMLNYSRYIMSNPELYDEVKND